MKSSRRVFGYGYRPMLWLNDALRGFRLRSTNRLRVVLFHDIAPEEVERFEKLLHRLMNRWRFVDVETFHAMLAKERPITGDNLLLTFDDGFMSNYSVAQTVLDALRIKALFFVPSAFVFLDDREEQKRFIAERIHASAMHVDQVSDHLRPMGVAELRKLLEAGHTIGAHTHTHARLSELLDEASLADEIEIPPSQVERKLGIQIKDFAYPFGNVASMSRRALALAKIRYPYVYSGLRGTNTAADSIGVIRRDALSPTDSQYYVDALLDGAVDWRYANGLATLEAMIER